MASGSGRAHSELDADYSPQFIRVARSICDRITDGTYPKCSLVPGSRQLAAEFGVSQVVALHGLTVLRSGWIPAARRGEAASSDLGQDFGRDEGDGGTGVTRMELILENGRPASEMDNQEFAQRRAATGDCPW